jgi:hypothetical protein
MPNSTSLDRTNFGSGKNLLSLTCAATIYFARTTGFTTPLSKIINSDSSFPTSTYYSTTSSPLNLTSFYITQSFPLFFFFFFGIHIKKKLNLNKIKNSKL